MNTITIPVLCIDKKSNYRLLSQNRLHFREEFYNLDLYDKNRDAYTFNSSQKLIAHPPCQQWSKLKGLATYNKREKEIALFCWEKVNQNGGILEHPLGSSLFNYVNADKKKIYLVHQHIFGFAAQKPTLLYCHNINILPIPSHMPGVYADLKNVNEITANLRSRMTSRFCVYLIKSLLNELQD